MTLFRLNRLFHPASRRSLAIAVDHGMPGEPDLLDGIEDMEAVIDKLVAGEPEALLPATATVIGIVVLAQLPTALEALGVALVIIGVAVHRDTDAT